MAQKFIKATGLHNVFKAVSNNTSLALDQIKDGETRVNQNSIVFLTATQIDETSYGFKAGSKYIWTQNELYPTSLYVQDLEDTEFVFAQHVNDIYDIIDNITDENVKQNLGTGDIMYPVLTAPNQISIGSQTTVSYYQPTVKVNPEKHSIIIGHTDGTANINSIGTGSYAQGYARNNISIDSSGYGSHAEGISTKALNNGSHAEGYQTEASGEYSGTLGFGNVYPGASHAEGFNTCATDWAAHAEGYYTTASNKYSHAEGWNTTASGAAAHAEGYNTQATNNNAHAEGHSTDASGNDSHAEGFETTASSTASHAEGYNTRATNNNAHAEGHNTHAAGYDSHAEGCETHATGWAAHAEGRNTLASKKAAHAEGHKTIASEENSHAEGFETTASQYNAHAEGKLTTASGITSHAEGYNTESSGMYAHAEGMETIASGIAAHAEGYNTYAGGDYSHAGGEDTSISGTASFAMGRGLEANIDYVTVIGQYNAACNANDIFVVGNGTGTGTSRKTVFKINGTTGASVTVSVTGRVNADAGFFQTSDINMKNIISDLDLNTAYNLIDKCQTIIYTLKDDPNNKEQIGMIAQEVQEFFPELINTDENGNLSLDYSRLTVVIFKVLKNLIKRIDKLEQKLL